MGVWDFDEFFIPRAPHKTILDVIAATVPPPGAPPPPPPLRPGATKGANAAAERGPGWAGGDAHPYCYLQLRSQVRSSIPPI